jgi:hypothetical protein
MAKKQKQAVAGRDLAKGSTQDAVAVILEQERKRKRRAVRRARRRRREAEKQHHAAMERMRQSIEVIKVCVLSISTVMVVSLVIGLVVLNGIKNEAERIQAEVENIQREAEMIRDKIRHPLETLGGAVGRQLDSNVGEMFRGDE